MSDAAWRLRLRLKQIRWHLTGYAGPSIRVRIKLLELRYRIAVSAAKLICHGNEFGVHTDTFEPAGRHCFCARTRRHFDYIPF